MSHKMIDKKARAFCTYIQMSIRSTIQAQNLISINSRNMQPTHSLSQEIVSIDSLGTTNHDFISILE